VPAERVFALANLTQDAVAAAAGPAWADSRFRPNRRMQTDVAKLARSDTRPLGARICTTGPQCGFLQTAHSCEPIFTSREAFPARKGEPKLRSAACISRPRW